MSHDEPCSEPWLTELRVLRAQVAELESTAERQRQSEERFRKIFESSNDAIFLVDPLQDEILDVNPQACRLLGYSREELLAVPISLIHPQEMTRFRAFVQMVLHEGRGWSDELTCTTKTQAALSAEISASMIEIDGRPCLLALVRDTSERERLMRERAYLQEEMRSESRFGTIIGRSEAIRKVIEQIRIVAPTDAGVLITGESGTGKELVARAIHDQSRRADGALVRVNCAAIPGDLFESEFFGHVKGAFTGALSDRTGRFALASGGSLFLDEIGEIPLPLQGKLLPVLQEGEFEPVGAMRTQKVDVRIIAASNRDLLGESRVHRFRPDLYYRLSVFVIEIPPLRDRPEDVAPLAEYFLQESGRRLGLPRFRLTAAQARQLEQYPWPGNVRELQSVIERAVILAGRTGRLHFELGAAPAVDSASPRPGGAPPAGWTLDDLKRAERDIVLRALVEAKGKLYGPDGAARRLGLKPTTLASRIQRLGIRKTEFLPDS